jgi:hypothetical protein
MHALSTEGDAAGDGSSVPPTTCCLERPTVEPAPTAATVVVADGESKLGHPSQRRGHLTFGSALRSLSQRMSEREVAMTTAQQGDGSVVQVSENRGSVGNSKAKKRAKVTKRLAAGAEAVGLDGTPQQQSITNFFVKH